jgi:signal transduction histidine kinase
VTLSLRARFALLGALLVLAVASCVAVGAYLTMRSSLLDRAARTAQAQATQLRGLIDVPSGAGADSQGNRVGIADPALTHELGSPGALIQVSRPNGQLIQTAAGHGSAPRLPAAFTARCVRDGHAAMRLAQPPLALACDRVGSFARPLGTVSVGAPLGDVFASLRTLRTALILGVLGGALLAAALAWFVARRATRPIRRIAETAETIRSGDLGRRIGYRGRDELGRLAAVLDACFAELEQSLERQRRFGADASHELRTPLAAIRANVELLRDWATTDPAARQAAIASLEQASSRAARLVDDLLYLARVERQPPQVHAPVRLDEVVLSVVREAAQLRPDVPIHVANLDEATVDGDALRLQQLLINLLDNALRVSPRQGTVTIGLAAGPVEATITVSDRGPGIEPDQLPRLFERLYSGPRPPTEHAGSGLGLSIAQAIARDHHGVLGAENNPGGGATFTLRLPVRSPDRAPEAEPVAGAPR